MRDGNDTVVIRNSSIDGSIDGGSGDDMLWLQGVNNSGGIQSHITGFENIKFSDGSVIGNVSAFDTITRMFDVTTTNVTNYAYTISLKASLTDTDGSESLSNITIEGLPSELTSVFVSDQPYTITNGTVSMSVVSGEETNILLVSSTVLSATELGSISASVTSTEISSGESVTTTLSYTTPIMLDMNFDGEYTPFQWIRGYYLISMPTVIQTK